MAGAGSAGTKRGQVSSQTVLIIFAVAVAVAFAVWFTVGKSAIEAQDVIGACRLSTILSSWQLKQDVLVTKLEVMDSPFSLDCKTLFTEITKEGINRAKVPISFGKGATPSQKKDKLREAIMQEMKQCWYMFGQGRVKVEEAVDTEGKTACIVCSEIVPTKEFVDDMQKNSPEVLKLDKMYAYAAGNKVPPENSVPYLDYMLDNAKVRPDISVEGEVSKPGVKYVPEPEIDLSKRYSVVFAVADRGAGVGIFDRKTELKAGSGIVGCYLGGYGGNPIKGEDAKAIGCSNDGLNGDGLVFGKVIDGGKHTELLSWKKFVPGFIGVEFKRFPMTVRLVPTEKLVSGSFCKRLYA